MNRLILILTLSCVTPALAPLAPLARAAEVTDATGRTVTIPDHIRHVLPAGPPAEALLVAIAPGQLIGVPEPLSDAAKTELPQAAANLAAAPRMTGHEDNTAAIQALHPDLIIDYGTVSPRYKQLAEDTQRKTGIPTLLFDGSLDQIPAVARTLGRILHQPERAEAVAQTAEAILALPAAAGPHQTLPAAAGPHQTLPAAAGPHQTLPAAAGPHQTLPTPSAPHPSVLYARGADGLLVAAPNTDVTAVFTRLGWRVLAPEGTGTFHKATIDQIRTLDPDIIILADPAAKDLFKTAPWSALRAVRDGHAYIAPSGPFGWIEQPPSINRLLGLAWLRGGDPLTLAALFNPPLYGHVLTQDQLLAIAGNAQPITTQSITTQSITTQPITTQPVKP